MARIDYPDLAAVDSEMREFINGKPPLNILRMLVHAPGIAPAFADLGVQHFRSLQLSAHMRELAILVCSREFAAPYEWAQHVPISRRFGVTDAQRAAIVAARYEDPAFSDDEQALVMFVSAVAKSPMIDEDPFSRFRAYFSDRITVEVILLVGYYFTIARVATGLDLEIDVPEGDAVIRHLAGSP